MRFVFDGTPDELKDHIRASANAFHKDIVIYQYEPTVLQIGFLRLGHSGGRFFVAHVIEENNSVILDGEIQNLNINMPTTDTQSAFEKLRAAACYFVFLYVFLALIPWFIWCAFDLPHPWISFVIPAAMIAVFGLLDFFINAFDKRKRNFDKEDDGFCQFMSLVVGEVTIPLHSQDLYEMLLRTKGLHSFPQMKGDTIIWELYDNACVEASIGEGDTIIDIIFPNRSYDSMHWHPDIEEMYGELCRIGKNGNIMVLRKLIFGTQVYYLGAPDKYRFDKSKKWHWGKLIYLEQK